MEAGHRFKPVEASPGKPPEAVETRDAPRRRRRFWPWLIVLLVLGGAGYGVYQNRPAAPDARPVSEEAPAERVMRLSTFDVATAAPRHLEETIRISGSLVPARQTTLSSPIGGKVLTIAVQPGDTVAEGDVIALLDTGDVLVQIDQQRSAIAATTAQLELARTQLASATALVEREIGSRASLESAQANYNALSANLAAQEAQLRGIELNLAKARVTAPFAGVVATRGVQPEQTIAAGTAIASLVDIDTMEMHAVAPIGAADMLAPGQRAVITVEGLRGRTEQAEVLRISPVAIEGTRSIQVFIGLGNESGVLRGGMFATGEIVVAERADAVAVPVASIRHDAEGPHVLAVAEGRLERRAVEIVETWNGGRLVEIASGLEEGEIYVSVRLDELRPGMAVSLGGF